MADEQAQADAVAAQKAETKQLKDKANDEYAPEKSATKAAGRASRDQEATTKATSDRKSTTVAEKMEGAKKAISGKKERRCRTKDQQAAGEKQAVEKAVVEKAAADQKAAIQAAAPNTPRSQKRTHLVLYFKVVI